WDLHSSGSRNTLHWQWELSPGSGNPLCILFPTTQDRKAINFSDDFLLTTLTYMFEKPDVQAQVWKNQRTVHGLAKVKTWRLLESCRVHIIKFTSTQVILLVERRYLLTRFTWDQMLNNVRLEVKEESKAINFSDDFLLTTLTYMFEKPDVQAQVWKNQRTVHGLAKREDIYLQGSLGIKCSTMSD
nr:hypothetical protein [Tanacetum cinerariifolium]